MYLLLKKMLTFHCHVGLLQGMVVAIPTQAMHYVKENPSNFTIDVYQVSSPQNWVPFDDLYKVGPYHL